MCPLLFFSGLSPHTPTLPTLLNLPEPSEKPRGAKPPKENILCPLLFFSGFSPHAPTLPTLLNLPQPSEKPRGAKPPKKTTMRQILFYPASRLSLCLSLYFPPPWPSEKPRGASSRVIRRSAANHLIFRRLASAYACPILGAIAQASQFQRSLQIETRTRNYGEVPSQSGSATPSPSAGSAGISSSTPQALASRRWTHMRAKSSGFPVRRT